MKMKIKLKRLISSLLIMAFIISAVPVFASASDDEDDAADNVTVIYNRGFDDGWDWNKNAMIFLESLQKMHPKPEVLIHYGRLPDELRKRYQEFLPNYPWDMKLVSTEDRWGNPKLFPGEIVIRSARTSRLLLAAFPMLLERMRNPQARPIHRLIPYDIEYIINPPKLQK